MTPSCDGVNVNKFEGTHPTPILEQGAGHYVLVLTYFSCTFSCDFAFPFITFQDYTYINKKIMLSFHSKSDGVGKYEDGMRYEQHSQCQFDNMYSFVLFGFCCSCVCQITNKQLGCVFDIFLECY